MAKKTKVVAMTAPGSINYNDTKALLGDLWLFLTNDKMPNKAIIKKEAFDHEAGIMLDAVRDYASCNNALEIVEKERLKDIILQFLKFQKQYRAEERLRYHKEVARIGGPFTFKGATNEEILDKWLKTMEKGGGER